MCVREENICSSFPTPEPGTRRPVILFLRTCAPPSASFSVPCHPFIWNLNDLLPAASVSISRFLRTDSKCQRFPLPLPGAWRTPRRVIPSNGLAARCKEQRHRLPTAGVSRLLSGNPAACGGGLRPGRTQTEMSHILPLLPWETAHLGRILLRTSSGSGCRTPSAPPRAPGPPFLPSLCTSVWDLKEFMGDVAGKFTDGEQQYKQNKIKSFEICCKLKLLLSKRAIKIRFSERAHIQGSGAWSPDVTSVGLVPVSITKRAPAQRSVRAATERQCDSDRGGSSCWRVSWPLTGSPHNSALTSVMGTQAS